MLCGDRYALPQAGIAAGGSVSIWKCSPYTGDYSLTSVHNVYVLGVNKVGIFSTPKVTV